MRTPGKLHLTLFVLLALLLAAAPVFANATITIVNVNAPGEGFNDPTPRAPVGGNPGTTLGQQRLIAFQQAASIWGSILDSAVPIYIQAQFTPLACTATTAVLGAAGANEIFANFPGAPKPNTWYHV
ncbi:MAG TPA: peptidase, partial [Thermoanaerobaculia bacterium]|nr:peptidase [Thermoanaerobaculia bacterium]